MQIKENNNRCEGREKEVYYEGIVGRKKRSIAK